MRSTLVRPAQRPGCKGFLVLFFKKEHSSTVPLGALRFLLALMVVAQHFQHLLPASGAVFFQRAGLGMVAVTVFFVISGFVVAEAGMLFYAGRPGAFLVNRLLRVVPPYLAALALSVVVQAALWRLGCLRTWDFAPGISPLQLPLIAAGVLILVPGFHTRMIAAEDFAFIPFVWTLRVEIAFYLAACLTLAAAAGFGARRVTGPVLVLALVSCAVFLVGGRPGLLGSGPMFLFGVSLCLLRRRALPSRLAYAAACLVLTGVGFMSYGQHGAPVLAVQLTLIAMLLAGLCWIVAGGACPWPKRWDRRLGGLSYPLYLNHYVVGLWVYDIMAGCGVWYFLASMVMSLLLSLAMACLVERPLERVRSRVRLISL
jgi:peptidoglycan/LPS O-acetylase OafA/YrhL